MSDYKTHKEIVYDQLLEYMNSGQYDKDFKENQVDIAVQMKVESLRKEQELVDIEELILKMGFKLQEGVGEITLKDETKSTGFSHWDKMYIRIDLDDRPWGCTIFTNKDTPNYIRVDAAVAPGAVFGHLGMKKYEGNIEWNKKTLMIMLHQVLGHITIK